MVNDSHPHGGRITPWFDRGLVTASERFQQHLFRLLGDLGLEGCPLLQSLLRNNETGTIMVVHVDDPMASGPPGDVDEAW